MTQISDLIHNRKLSLCEVTKLMIASYMITEDELIQLYLDKIENYCFNKEGKELKIKITAKGKNWGRNNKKLVDWYNSFC